LILLLFVFCVSFLSVMIGRYAAVSERTEEVVILRAMGASSSYILDLLFQETLLITIPGTIVGIAMAYGTKWLIAHTISDLLIQETVLKWWLIAGAISVVGALLGAILPAWKAIRQDPVKVLSCEE
jgi:putative ABC transport system permease protein